MNTFETWRPVIEALGWILIHFIWQGTLIAMMLACTLRLLKGTSANARYVAAFITLLLMLAAPLSTIALIGFPTPIQTTRRPSAITVVESPPQPLPVEIAQTVAPTRTDIAKVSSRVWLLVLIASLVSLLPWVSLLWLLGVVFFSLRLVGGWLYTQRLKSHGIRPTGDDWQQTLRRLCDQLKVSKRITLLESALVKVPTVIGWLRPVILLPIGMLSGLTTQQMEGIIAHELAHIRRHDYLINLLQAVIETLLFYHPAVWWVSHRIRQEREHCCDDLAVYVCGDALTYARALLEIEQLRSTGQHLGLAANGGMLMNRIQRLIGRQPKYTNRFTGLFAGIIVLTVLVSIGVGAQISLFHNFPSNGNRRVSAEFFADRNAETTSSEPVVSIKPRSSKSPSPQMVPVAGPQALIPAEIAERIEELGSPIPEERAASACALGTMTTRAVPAIPHLIALLSDGAPIDPRQSCKNEPPFEDESWQPKYEQVREPSPGEAATHALMAIGESALEPLMTALLHSNQLEGTQECRLGIGASGSGYRTVDCSFKG